VEIPVLVLPLAELLQAMLGSLVADVRAVVDGLEMVVMMLTAKLFPFLGLLIGLGERRQDHRAKGEPAHRS
jgi:hypothetical protein